MNIDSQGLFVRDAHGRDDLSSTTTGGSTSLASRESESPTRHETPGSRAMRVSLARAFPVRTARLREALANGSITKLSRP